MLFHCGLLDEQPEKSRTLQWVKRPIWGRLPPDIEHDLRVFLATPGFAYSYLAHVFRLSIPYVRRHVPADIPEHLRGEVAANWNSATRQDCIRLARLRPGQGNVPVICQMRAVQDMKSGMTSTMIGVDYAVSDDIVRSWSTTGVRSNRPLPSGFALLAA